MNKLKVFEINSGIGCYSQALENLGFEYEVVGISETNMYALESYYALHGKHKNYGDINYLKADRIPNFDLLTYSFDLSELKNFKNDFGVLYKSLEVIKSKKPRILISESPKRILDKNNVVNFRLWKRALKDLGYKNLTHEFNALDFGIPQNRQRVYLISIRKDSGFPLDIFDISPITERPYSDLEDFIEETTDEIFEKYKITDNKLKNYVEYDINISHEQINVCGTVKNPKSKIGQRDQVYYKRGYIGALMESDYRDPKKICVSDSTCKDSVKIRKLTRKEYWLLMGFSNEQFEKVDRIGHSNSQMYSLAGRGAVIQALEYILKLTLFEYKRKLKNQQKK